MRRSVRQLVTVLGRKRRPGDQMPGAVIGEIVKEEYRAFAQQGPGAFAKEVTVARERVVIPGMQREPRAAHRPDAVRNAVDGMCIPPDIRVVVDDEAIRAV